MELSRTRVSLLSRTGTCGLLLASALMTFPRARRLLLIWFASRSCAPTAPVFFVRSEPARSTRLSRARLTLRRRAPTPSPSTSGAVARSLFASRTWKMAWLRLDCLFILVSA